MGCGDEVPPKLGDEQGPDRVVKVPVADFSEEYHDLVEVEGWSTGAELVLALAFIRVERRQEAFLAYLRGNQQSGCWVFIERERGVALAVGPYRDEDAAEAALGTGVLVRALVLADSVDCYVLDTCDLPVVHEKVVVTPGNPDHFGVPEVEEGLTGEQILAFDRLVQQEGR